jgi:hypothetical protein
MAEKLACSKCGESYPDEYFSVSKKYVGRRGRACWCRACRNAALRKWRAKNSNHVTEYSRNYRKANPGLSTWYKIGVSQEMKLAKFKEQGEVCAGCGGTSHYTVKGSPAATSLSAWCADHDHKTGKFRGVLCQNCNFILGRADDSVETLAGLIAYLKKYKVERG